MVGKGKPGLVLPYLKSPIFSFKIENILAVFNLFKIITICDGLMITPIKV
jgi:hypothetical protein